MTASLPHSTIDSLWVALHKHKAAASAAGLGVEAAVPTFPQLSGDGGEFDVVVIGAGITGLSSALTLAEAGYRVAVLEGSTVASGVTSHSTSKVSAQHMLCCAALSKDNAAKYAAMNGAGMSLIERTVERYGIDADLSRRPHGLYTWSDASLPALRKELAAARDAGIVGAQLHTADELTAAGEKPLPFVELPASMGVKAVLTYPNQLQINIYSYCVGLARVLSQRLGVTIWEHSRATDVSRASPHEVVTAQGRVRGRFVIVATHMPILDRSLHFSLCTPSAEYAIAVQLRSGGGERPIPMTGMYINMEPTVRSLRQGGSGGGAWPSGGEDVLVVAGGDHPFGSPGKDPRAHYAELEAWAREHFPVEAVVARWMAEDYSAGDTRAYIGRMNRGCDTLLTATGFAKWGLSTGSAAGVAFRDHIRRLMPLAGAGAPASVGVGTAPAAGAAGGAGGPTVLVPAIQLAADAAGAGVSGMAAGGLAGGGAMRACDADSVAWADYFAGERWDMPKAAKGLLEETAHTVKHFVGDKVKHAVSRKAIADLAPGEGDIIMHKGRKVAAYRRPDGSIIACSATCTHLGCDVVYNAADTCYDCPCHGSRFSVEGKVLHAPAVKDLEPLDLDW